MEKEDIDVIFWGNIEKICLNIDEINIKELFIEYNHNDDSYNKDYYLSRLSILVKKNENNILSYNNRYRPHAMCDSYSHLTFYELYALICIFDNKYSNNDDDYIFDELNFFIKNALKILGFIGDKKIIVAQLEFEKCLLNFRYIASKCYTSPQKIMGGCHVTPHLSGLKTKKIDGIPIHTIVQIVMGQFIDKNDWDGAVALVTFTLFEVTQLVRFELMRKVMLTNATRNIEPGMDNKEAKKELNLVTERNMNDTLKKICGIYSLSSSIPAHRYTSLKKAADVCVADTNATREAILLCKIRDKEYSSSPLRVPIIPSIDEIIINPLTTLINMYMLADFDSEITKLVYKGIRSNWFGGAGDFNNKHYVNLVKREENKKVNDKAKEDEIKPNTVTKMIKSVQASHERLTKLNPIDVMSLTEITHLMKLISSALKFEDDSKYEFSKLIYSTPSYITDPKFKDIREMYFKNLERTFDNYKNSDPFISFYLLRGSDNTLKSWDDIEYKNPHLGRGPLGGPLKFEHKYQHRRIISDIFPELPDDDGVTAKWFMLSNIQTTVDFYSLWRSDLEKGRYYIIYNHEDMIWKDLLNNGNDDDNDMRHESDLPGRLYLCVTNEDPEICKKNLKKNDIKLENLTIHDNDLLKQIDLVKKGICVYLDMDSFAEQTRSSVFITLTLATDKRIMRLCDSFCPNTRNRFSFKIPQDQFKSIFLNDITYIQARDHKDLNFISFKPQYNSCDVLYKKENDTEWKVLNSVTYVRDDRQPVGKWPFREEKLIRRVKWYHVYKAWCIRYVDSLIKAYEKCPYITISFDDDTNHVAIYPSYMPNVWCVPNSKYNLNFKFDYGNEEYSACNENPIPNISTTCDIVKQSNKKKIIQAEWRELLDAKILQIELKRSNTTLHSFEEASFVYSAIANESISKNISINSILLNNVSYLLNDHDYENIRELGYLLGCTKYDYIILINKNCVKYYEIWKEFYDPGRLLVKTGCIDDYNECNGTNTHESRKLISSLNDIENKNRNKMQKIKIDISRYLAACGHSITAEELTDIRHNVNTYISKHAIIYVNEHGVGIDYDGDNVEYKRKQKHKNKSTIKRNKSNNDTNNGIQLKMNNYINYGSDTFSFSSSSSSSSGSHIVNTPSTNIKNNEKRQQINIKEAFFIQKNKIKNNILSTIGEISQ